MKHGPIALIDEQTPSVVVIPRDSMHEKTFSNLQEIKARKGPIIALATEGDTELAKKADDVIYVPATIEPLSPLLTIIPLQLLAYHIAVAARLRRGQAAQPGQERDGGVSGFVVAQVSNLLYCRLLVQFNQNCSHCMGLASTRQRLGVRQTSGALDCVLRRLCVFEAIV